VTNLKKQLTAEELEQCTFKPSTLERSHLDSVFETDYSTLNVSAIEKYLERINQARLMKEEEEFKWEARVGSGNHWRPKVTIPKGPSLLDKHGEKYNMMPSNEMDYYRHIKDDVKQARQPANRYERQQDISIGDVQSSKQETNEEAKEANSLFIM